MQCKVIAGNNGNFSNPNNPILGAETFGIMHAINQKQSLLVTNKYILPTNAVCTQTYNGYLG